MGSRIVHLSIANKILSSELTFDRTRFMVGNLAPDAPRRNKQESHFAITDKSDNSENLIDFERFLKKYAVHLEDSFYLGYLCHLLLDVSWYKDIYKPYVEDYPMNESEKLRLYYEDLWMLNSKLINRYNLKNDVYLIKDFSLDEISIESLGRVLKNVDDDFNFDSNKNNLKLNFISEECAIRHIDTSSSYFMDRLRSYGILS